MKKRIAALLGMALLWTVSCELLSPSLVLDNQSDYEVTIKLETGKQNEDGSIAWETFTVAAQSKTTVKLEDTNILVDSYSPSDLVEMETQEARRKIVFKNKEE